jgi:hypothetical protein
VILFSRQWRVRNQGKVPVHVEVGVKRIGLVALAFGLAAVPCVRADTLNVAADAHTNSAQPSLKLGQSPAMAVGRVAGGSLLTSYARFDLSPLPSHAALQKATLRLWVLAVVTPGRVEVVPIVEPWAEGTITAGSSPDLGAPVATFAVESGDAMHFIDVDVTGLVQDWAGGSLDNNGLALRVVEGGAVIVIFDTKECTLTSHAPEAASRDRRGHGERMGRRVPRDNRAHQVRQDRPDKVCREARFFWASREMRRSSPRGSAIPAWSAARSGNPPRRRARHPPANPTRRCGPARACSSGAGVALSTAPGRISSSTPGANMTRPLTPGQR